MKALFSKALLTLLSVALLSSASAQLDDLNTYPKDCATKEFKSKNGLDEYVKVKFSCLGDASLEEDAMKRFAWSVMPKCKYSCKNKGTFVPVKLELMPMDGELKAIVQFRAANAYGVEDLITKYFNVDSEGNVTDL